MTASTLLPQITTEELILNILISRHKLGESRWPFDKCHQTALATLEKRGLIHTRPGVVRNTTRAALTDHALTMITIHGDDVFTVSNEASENQENPEFGCESACRHRCPECRMGLGSHLVCDPHCDHHAPVLDSAAAPH